MLRLTNPNPRPAPGRSGLLGQGRGAYTLRVVLCSTQQQTKVSYHRQDSHRMPNPNASPPLEQRNCSAEKEKLGNALGHVGSAGDGEIHLSTQIVSDLSQDSGEISIDCSSVVQDGTDVYKTFPISPHDQFLFFSSSPQGSLHLDLQHTLPTPDERLPANHLTGIPRHRLKGLSSTHVYILSHHRVEDIYITTSTLATR